MCHCTFISQQCLCSDLPKRFIDNRMHMQTSLKKLFIKINISFTSCKSTSFFFFFYQFRLIKLPSTLYMYDVHRFQCASFLCKKMFFMYKQTQLPVRPVLNLILCPIEVYYIQWKWKEWDIIYLIKGTWSLC